MITKSNKIVSQVARQKKTTGKTLKKSSSQSTNENRLKEKLHNGTHTWKSKKRRNIYFVFKNSNNMIEDAFHQLLSEIVQLVSHIDH